MFVICQMRQICWIYQSYRCSLKVELYRRHCTKQKNLFIFVHDNITSAKLMKCFVYDKPSPKWSFYLVTSSILVVFSTQCAFYTAFKVIKLLNNHSRGLKVVKRLEILKGIVYDPSKIWQPGWLFLNIFFTNCLVRQLFIFIQGTYCSELLQIDFV